ncbi:MAG: motif [Bryobacterales bacterium]|nr:motif [Bryobacterales bacterium]
MPGLVSIREVLKFTGQPSNPIPAAPVAQPADQPATSGAALIAHTAKFTERTQFTPRNAPCACGSGEKYKRCCGRNAPAVPGNWLQLRKDAA